MVSLFIDQEFALQPAVVQAALLVCAFAKGALEHRVGGDGAQAPAGMALKELVHLAVELLAGLTVGEALAVGRVAQEHAGLALQLQLLQGDVRQLNLPGKTGLLDVAAGQLESLGVDV